MSQQTEHNYELIWLYPFHSKTPDNPKRVLRKKRRYRFKATDDTAAYRHADLWWQQHKSTKKYKLNNKDYYILRDRLLRVTEVTASATVLNNLRRPVAIANWLRGSGDLIIK